MFNKCKNRMGLDKLSNKFRRSPWLFFALAYILLAVVITVNAYLNLKRFRLSNAAAEFSFEHLLYSLFIALCFIILTYFIYRYINKIKGNRTFFDALIDHRYLVAGVLFVFTLAFSLNGFSLGCWDGFLNLTYGNNVIIGQYRQITSDTWQMGLPLIFNQIDNGFPLLNTDIMTNGLESLVMGLPVADICMIAKPFQWGFLLFGKTIGLSWYYYFKFFALLLSSYEICHYFIKKNKKIAFLFAIVITFSPALQWWFAQGMIDAVIGFQICLAALIIFVKHNQSTKMKIIASIAMSIGGSLFILVLYPGMQVPLGYLFLIMGVTLIATNRKDIQIRKMDVILILGVIVVVGTICYRFFSLTADGLALLGDTVFPGARMVMGGGYNAEEMFYVFYQWLLPGRDAALYNNCEVSFFIPFIPIIFLVFPIFMRKAKTWRYLPLFLYSLFLISWLFVKYPAEFAKYSLFSNVSEGRLDIVIGLISCYLAAIVVGTFTEKKIELKNLSAIIIASVSTGLCLIATWMLDSGGYISGRIKYPAILIAMAMVWLCAYAFCRWKKIWFCVIVSIIIFVSGFRINPVCFGTGPLFEGDLAKQIEIIDERDSDAVWMVNDGYPYVNYLAALGVRCINTLNPYPDMGKWLVIDKTGAFNDVYNRFAQVNIEIVDIPSIMTVDTADTILLKLNPNDADKLGVQYVLSRKDITSFGYTRLYHDQQSGFAIFENNE